MTQGIMLGHFVSNQGIQVDQNKITMISTLPMTQRHKDI